MIPGCHCLRVNDALMRRDLCHGDFGEGDAIQSNFKVSKNSCKLSFLMTVGKKTYL